MHLVLNLIAIDFFLSSLSLLFPLLRLLDGYGASVRSRWLVETGEGAHTGPWVPVQGEIDRPTATGIPLTGRQQEQVWNQPPDRQRTLSDGNYVYGWYGQILLDTPISEIYTGCWPVTNPNLSIIKIDSTISIITIFLNSNERLEDMEYAPRMKEGKKRYHCYWSIETIEDLRDCCLRIEILKRRNEITNYELNGRARKVAVSELFLNPLEWNVRDTRYVKYVRDGTLATDIVSDVRYGGKHRAVYNI